MALFSFLITASLCIVGREALSLSDCGAYARRPQMTVTSIAFNNNISSSQEYSDIAVACGTSSIDLAIQICPVIYTGYNESLVVLNHIQNMDCQGTLDTSVAPPVVRFSFPIRQGNACGSTFLTMSTLGTGLFSDFSNIQTVNISGMVRSFDPSNGIVTYNAELKYYYSCSYPLEYLINNTYVDVSSSSIAFKDNNGSFLSTLSMTLYQDRNYTTPLVMPSLGVGLKTNIYVQVSASNLSSQYFVLLDRCYASLSPLPTNSSYFNLFVSCSIDPMTTMLENGVSHKARFYFPAFHFTKQKNETISTYYLHCITRLCEPSTCSTFKQCNRKKRSVENAVKQEGITTASELTVAIRMEAENAAAAKDEALSGGQADGKGVPLGLGVAMAILIVIGVAAILMAASFYLKLK